MPNRRFPREFHIRRAADFRRAYERRCTAADGTLLVFAAPNGLQHPRLGLSVSRKVGKAVLRNRWKRLIREAFRLSREQLPPGVDLVVLPRGDEPELKAIMSSLPRLARKAASKLKA